MKMRKVENAKRNRKQKQKEKQRKINNYVKFHEAGSEYKLPYMRSMLSDC
jgi:hypothetical protein